MCNLTFHHFPWRSRLNSIWTERHITGSAEHFPKSCPVIFYNYTALWTLWSYLLPIYTGKSDKVVRQFLFLNVVLICKGISVDVACVVWAMGIWAAGSWRDWFMLMLGICINSDMFLLLYHRGPFCLWPKLSRPPRLYSWTLFTMRAVTGLELLQRNLCHVLRSRQKTALWGTTGIHKYSSLEKFMEFVVKDLWWAAEVVTGWGWRSSALLLVHGVEKRK